MADYTKTILVAVETDTDSARQGMQRFGESLSSSAEALNKLRSGIDDTIDGLKLYGERGQRVASQIEAISDPTRRLAAAKAALASEAKRADSALGRLGSALEATRVNASLALGGSEAVTRGLTLLGGAALVAGGALVTGVVKGLETYLASDAKASKALEGLTDRFNRLLFTFGEAIVGGDRLGAAFDLVGKVLDELTKKVGDNRQQIADGTLGIVEALSYVAEGALKMGLGVQIFFQGIVDSVQYLVQQVTLGYLNLFKLIDRWRGIETSAANNEWLRLVASDNPFAETEAMAARLDRVSEGFERLRAGISAVGATPLGAAREYTPQSGRGGGAPRATLPEGFSLSTSQVDEVLLLLEIAKDRERFFDGLIIGQDARALGEDVGARAIERIGARGEGKRLTNVNSAIQAASAKLGEGIGPASEAATRFQEQMDSLTATVVGFGVQSFQAFAAFATGAKSGKQALGEVLASLGALAVQTGTFFILAGTASSALPFLGLSGGAAIGAGIGLVALGTGLQLGGAALASSGAKSGAGGGAGAGGFASFGPQLPQAQGAEPQKEEVFLILDGERVAALLGPRFQQLGELGHLRLPLAVGA